MNINIIKKERRIWELKEYLIAKGLSDKLALSSLISDFMNLLDNGDSYEMITIILQSMNTTCGSYEDLESYL